MSTYRAHILAADTHANRPAASTVPDGALFPCTTDGTLDMNNAGSWVTWATIVAYTDEQARDAVGAALVAGPGVGIVVDDPGNTITISSTTRTINAQTGTSYTLVLADAGKFVTMSNAAASTLTIPPNSSVAFPVGTFIEGAQLGAGQVTLTPGAGVTINATPGAKVAAQYGTFGLLKIATDTWVAYGRLSS